MYKYVVFDLIKTKYYCKYNRTDEYFWDEEYSSALEFDSEEEAWKYAGIYCTVIKVRIN